MAWNPPKTCGNGGHPMTHTSWTPCDCGRATGGPAGHNVSRCGTCRWEYREGGCDKLRDGFPIDLPHSGTGNPGDRGYPGGP